MKPILIVAGGQAACFDAASGALRWNLDLLAPPAGGSLALDRDGNAIIGLQDGSVVCVGKPPDGFTERRP